MSHESTPIPRIVNAAIRPTEANHKYDQRDYVILVMGPIGAGKSRFIEALAKNDEMGISKDQLDSCTQTITTYDLVDIEVWLGPERGTLKIEDDAFRAHIIDSPGFSDSQISELEIIEMVNLWMKDRNLNIHSILYLSPITDTRLSGSKRKTIEMLKMVGGIDTDTPGAVYVVTTMWDRIWNERGRMAAEARHAQLSDDIWGDLPKAYGVKPITKFLNTHESALEIISTTFTWTEDLKPRENMYDAYDIAHIGPLNEARFIPHLYRELLDRIENVRQQKQNLELELAEPEVQENMELKSLLQQRWQNVDRLLTKFETQLINFGQPPLGFEAAAPLREALIDKYNSPRTVIPLPFVSPGYKIGAPTQSPSKGSAFKRALLKGIKSVKDKAKRRK